MCLCDDDRYCDDCLAYHNALSQEQKDKWFEELLRAEEKRQRDVVKKACLAGLIALGLVPQSLVQERYLEA